MITKKWVVNCGEGHWEIYRDGKFVAACDDNELNDVLLEINQMAA